MYMKLFSSPIPVALSSFVALYLFALYYLQVHAARDPTSLFFDPRHAYVPGYSTFRQREAEDFVATAASAPSAPLAETPMSTIHNQTLCVGIASVARDGATYLRATIGSLLEGLSAQERDDIYLVLFIAHTDPTAHPAYSETWPEKLANEVLVYHMTPDQITHIARLEQDKGSIREKALFDYTYLLKACHSKGIPYIAMFEDDIVAMDGWYHRTVAALKQAEVQSTVDRASLDFMYLRLFYTEEFLGWNSEDWPTYVSWSLLWVIGPAVFLAYIRSCVASAKKLLSDPIILVSCFVCIPMLIGLFFAAGKVTMLPLPAGVNAMNQYGCCSQGLVFPRHKAHELIEWYETKRIGFVDVLTEEYADQRHELRWALTPSVIQHVGRKSSKGDDFGAASKYHMSVAEKLWNFAFEQNSAVDLRVEHSRVTNN